MRARELQQRIAKAREEIDAIARGSPASPAAPAELARRHAEIAICASQLAEISTRRLVWLTWALVILTAALLAYTIRLYQYARTEAEHHHQLEQPDVSHKP